MFKCCKKCWHLVEACLGETNLAASERGMYSSFLPPDESPQFNFTREKGARLFDFQQRGITKAVAALTLQKSFGLAIDAGLGKTLCATKIIAKYMELHPTARVLVVAPGGLVRQLVAGLSRFPWGASSGLTVRRAEKGMDLTRETTVGLRPERSVGLRPERSVEEEETGPSTTSPHDGTVLVVNKALKWLSHVDDFRLIVVDEAHTISAATAKVLRRRVVLALSATPENAFHMFMALNMHPLRRHMTRTERADTTARIFNVRKTERVMKLVGTARTVLRKRTSALPDLRSYFEELASWAMSSHVHPMMRLVLVHTVDMLARKSNIMLETPDMGAFTALLREVVLVAGTVMVRSSSRFHPPTGARCLAQRRAYSRACEFVGARKVPFPSLSEAHHAALTMSERMESEDGHGVNECSCCGLTPQEIELLHRAHTSMAPEPELFCTAEQERKFGEEAVFSSAIVRFPCAHQAKRRAEQLKKDPSLQVHLLCSSMTASARSRAIAQFCSYGGCRSKWAMFKKGIRNTENPLCERIFAGPFGVFNMALIAAFLVKRRLLVCDQTIDTGFDLHRHVDSIIIPRMISTRRDFMQLVGRASRIAVEVHEQGAIELQTAKIENTADEIFEKHVETGGPIVHLRPDGAYRCYEVFDIMSQEISSRLGDDAILREWFEEQIAKRQRTA